MTPHMWSLRITAIVNSRRAVRNGVRDLGMTRAVVIRDRTHIMQSAPGGPWDAE